MGGELGDEDRGSRRAGAGVVLAVLVLLAVGCQSWGGGKDLGPLSERDFDDLYLKRAVGTIIHEALTEANPEALRRFFPPSARSGVDCRAFYREVMGGPPGAYQPRFWEMKLLDIQYEEGRQRARTSLTLECADQRPGSGGAGKFIPLKLTWVKQAGDWYLEPTGRPVIRPGGAAPERQGQGDTGEIELIP